MLIFDKILLYLIDFAIIIIYNIESQNVKDNVAIKLINEHEGGSRMENTNKGQGLAIASMVLGIVGLLTSCIAIGGILCILGLLLAISALIKNRHSGIAIAGLVLSLIGTILFILTLSGILYFNQIMQDVKNHNGEKTPIETTVPTNNSINPSSPEQTPAAPSSTNKPTKKEKYEKYAEQIKISVYNKKILPIDYEKARFQEFIEIDYKVKNKSPKAIDGIKGTLDVYDQFDELIVSIRWDISKSVKAGESKKITGYGVDYNKYLDKYQKLYDTELKKLTFKYEFEQINFADGYKLKF